MLKTITLATIFFTAISASADDANTLASAPIGTKIGGMTVINRCDNKVPNSRIYLVCGEVYKCRDLAKDAILASFRFSPNSEDWGTLRQKKLKDSGYILFKAWVEIEDRFGRRDATQRQVLLRQIGSECELISVLAP